MHGDFHCSCQYFVKYDPQFNSNHEGSYLEGSTARAHQTGAWSKGSPFPSPGAPAGEGDLEGDLDRIASIWSTTLWVSTERSVARRMGVHGNIAIRFYLFG